MRSRLFKLARSVACGVLSSAALAGCGDKFNAATASSGSGSSGDGNVSGSANAGAGGSANAGAGGSGNAGAGGSANAGAGGNAGAAGSGGSPPSACGICAAGMYCQAVANKCRSCADFSRLEFAAPQKISVPGQTLRSDRFPRAASPGLFYRSGAGDNQRVFYSATTAAAAGTAVSPVTELDSGPLSAAGVLQQNFFFDTLDQATNLRHLMVGNWTGSKLTDAAPAPAPLNGDTSDFSIAIAPGVARAYWMSTRNGKPAAELLWAGMVGGAPSAPAVVDLQVQVGDMTCPWLGDPKTGEDDATPWVNAAGTLLLFRSESVDTSCVPSDSGGFDLFAAPLAKDTGQPSTAGIPLSSLNEIGGGSTQTDPSLSADSCEIYFASDSGAGNTDLYVATRD